ncbi:MAG: DUF6036 family nucleotidyltransferase, partial [bacterium]
QHWGIPRLTHDLDLTIVIPIEKTDYYIDLLLSKFTPRISEVKEMAKKHRILLLYASNGCDVDVSIGLPGYEEELIKRAKSLKLQQGQEVFICSPEDLIIHKAVAGRTQDTRDIIGVINRQGSKLDVEYVRSWLKKFSVILEIDDVLNRFEQPYTEWQNYSKQV